MTKTETKQQAEILAPKAAERALPATVPQASSAVTPMQLLERAMETGADLDRLERLMALQRQWEADQARKAFVADMAEFKKNPPRIVKDKQVGYEGRDGFVGYAHATLGNVTNAIVEGLAKHGFSHRWNVSQQNTLVEVECVITHRLGHSEAVKMVAGKDDSGKKNLIQQVASAVTYLQRYTLLAATGLATHEAIDDDGAAAGSLDTTLADKWIALAKAAKAIPELNGVWERGVAEITEAGDQHAYHEFRDACNARKKELATAAPGQAQPHRSSRVANIVGTGQQGGR